MTPTIADEVHPPIATRTAPHWRKLHAFGLPEGSVRALLALAIFATIWAVLARNPESEVPDYLRDLLFIIMGHYFASRRRSGDAGATGPAPLYLPRGTIRLILFGGFVAVAAVLAREGKMREPARYPGVVTLMLVGGFLLGVILGKLGDWWVARGRTVPRWIEDVKAAVSMIAAAGLIVLVWNRFDPLLIPRQPDLFANMNLKLGSYGPEHVLGAIVGFYFGSKS